MSTLGVLLLSLCLSVSVVAGQQCEVVLPNPTGPTTQSGNGSASLNSTARIVNGRIAHPGTAPYLVSFHRTRSGGSFCTGSLISERWVLTAAHCEISTSTSAKPTYVRLGGALAEEGVLREISKVVIHEDFGKEVIKAREILDDDIAIVQLATPAPPNMKFMLINSNKNVPDPPHWARVSGYGVTGVRRRDTGTLRSVDVPIKSSARCAALFFGTVSSGASTGLKIKDELQFCAGYKDGHCDSCQGDSGGPLYVFDKDNNPVQIGITSFGISCAAKKRPGIYVRVSAYTSWLSRNGATFRTTKGGQNHKSRPGLEDESFLDNLNPICFPSDARVMLRGGASKSMAQLAIGDEVLTSAGEYSPVFMFTHKLARGAYPFVALDHAAGAITLSASHYIFLNGEMHPAKEAKVGDVLELADGSRTPILRVRSVLKQGLYNPQTVSGTIVVDGVKASAYTTAVTPMAAHSLLRPMSMVYRLLGIDASGGFFDELMLGTGRN